jgi:DHA1 family multidrug resistance protein-like MFS transporter
MIVSAFAAAQLLTQIPLARHSDRTGRTLLVSGGFGGMAVAAALYNLATLPSHFVLLQGLAGVASGCLWPPLMAMLTENTPPSERGWIMGAFNTVFFIGVGVGPLLGGYIASTFGHMAVFNVWAVSAVLGGLLCLVALRDRASEKGMLKGGRSRRPVTGSSLVKPGLWPTFAASCVVRSRGGFCTSFNNALLPLYAVMLFDASPKMIGSLMFIHGVGLAVFNLPGGSMSDRFGRRLPALLGSLVATGGVFWYSVPNGYLGLFVAVGLAGAGSAFAATAVSALTVDVSSAERRGEAFGYLLTSFNLGMVLGALIFGFVSDLVGLPGAVLAWGFTSLVLSLFGMLIREPEEQARVGLVTQPPPAS